MTQVRSRFVLRPYQVKALNAVWKCIESEEEVNPVVSLPTGAGKTIVIAKLALRAAKEGKRVLILAHVKELLDQSYRTIRRVSRKADVGLFSAGLNQKDFSSTILVAGIQSIASSIDSVLAHGPFDLVLIDEAHLVSENDKSRYRKVVARIKSYRENTPLGVSPKLSLKTNSRVHFVGFTATPYRTKSGLICKGKGIFNRIAYEKTVSSLIDEGYLSPIMSRVVNGEVETQGLHIRRGEFLDVEVNALVNKEEKIHAACSEIISKANEYDRKKILIFAANIKHAQNIQEKIQELSGEECALVLGDTSNSERDSILNEFKFGELRYVVNVGVLTTGFDNPAIDLVAIIRPTASPGFYYQMAGRGLRKCEGKDYCLLLDFGQNIRRHGPIDDMEIRTPKRRRPKRDFKVCPRCKLIITKETSKCPWCGAVIPKIYHKPKKRVALTKQSSDLDPLALRGREFFTKRGLINIRNIAKVFVRLYREGKFDNPPLDEKGKPVVYEQYKFVAKECNLSDLIFVFFHEENFKEDEFQKNESFRNELYDGLSRIEEIALMGTVQPFGRIISSELPCHNDGRIWHWRPCNGNFNPRRDSCRFWRNRDFYFIFDLRIQKRELLIKVIRSYLRKMFRSRDELEDFMSKPFPEAYFIKDLQAFKQRLISGEYSNLRYEREKQKQYDWECESARWEEKKQRMERRQSCDN